MPPKRCGEHRSLDKPHDTCYANDALLRKSFSGQMRVMSPKKWGHVLQSNIKSFAARGGLV
jgi:hypothetical protein